MQPSEVVEQVVGSAKYLLRGIETLRHLPPGDYLATDSPFKGKGKPFGIVSIKRKGVLSRLYTTSFSKLIDAGGPAWVGELESKFRMMSEGVYRYDHNHACGTQRLFLLNSGVIRVYIRDEGNPEYLEHLYWVKIDQKQEHAGGAVIRP